MDLIERAASRLKQSASPARPASPAVPPASADASASALQRARSVMGKRLVALDIDNLRRSGFIVPDDAPTRIAEEFRVVKRQLLRAASQAGESGDLADNLILVTSTQPGEGKTFCAINLALSIASERDLSVLLVDADVARPQLLAALSLDADRGLIDLLADDRLAAEDCILRTSIDNLTILPSGRPHPSSTELLSSDKMTALMDSLARRYPDTIIVFDSPPVLASSAPGVLAGHVGQIVYVIEAERTRETQILEGLGLLNDCHNINLLLNKTRFMGGNIRFGSYYEYYRH